MPDASFPPGRRVIASFARLFSPSLIAWTMASPTSLPLKPSANALAKDFPMLTPSAVTPPTSMPRSPMMPSWRAVPSPAPTLSAMPASHALPVPFHHSENGSTMILSHASLIFSHREPAFFHSGLAVSSFTDAMMPSIFPVTKSTACPTALSMSGICAVTQSTSPLA